jgi:hypothetical protein
VQSTVGDLERHHNDIWGILAGVDASALEVAGEQREMGCWITMLEHASFAPDTWRVIEELERGAEEASEVEGDLEVGEEEEEHKAEEEVDAMEEQGEVEWDIRVAVDEL